MPNGRYLTKLDHNQKNKKEIGEHNSADITAIVKDKDVKKKPAQRARLQDAQQLFNELTRQQLDLDRLKQVKKFRSTGRPNSDTTSQSRVFDIAVQKVQQEVAERYTNPRIVADTCAPHRHVYRRDTTLIQVIVASRLVDLFYDAVYTTIARLRADRRLKLIKSYFSQDIQKIVCNEKKTAKRVGCWEMSKPTKNKTILVPRSLTITSNPSASAEKGAENVYIDIPRPDLVSRQPVPLKVLEAHFRSRRTRRRTTCIK